MFRDGSWAPARIRSQRAVHYCFGHPNCVNFQVLTRMPDLSNEPLSIPDDNKVRHHHQDLRTGSTINDNRFHLGRTDFYRFLEPGLLRQFNFGELLCPSLRHRCRNADLGPKSCFTLSYPPNPVRRIHVFQLSQCKLHRIEISTNL